MAKFVGGEPISVGVDEPITFENKTDTAFDVGCGIVFRKSGLYRVSIVGRHMSVAVEPEQSRIEKELHGLSPDEQYAFLDTLMHKKSVGWNSRALYVKAWLAGEED